MNRPSKNETTAMESCLQPLWEYLQSIGIDRPPAVLSKQEILVLIETIVTAYQDRLREISSDDLPF